MKIYNAMAILLAASGVLLAGSAKISPDLQAADMNSSVRVIVQYAPASNPAVPGVVAGSGLGNIAAGLGSLLSGSSNGLGMLVNSLLNLVVGTLNAVVATVPVSQLANLASDPSVIYISPDRTLAARLDYTAAAVNAKAAWQAKLTGKGIGVAIIDSGVNQSPDLSLLGLLPRVVYTKDFTGGRGVDEYGHGTHVAGIIGANGLSSECFNCTRSLVGIAPDASFLNLRVLDVNGQGSDSAVIQAIGQAILLKKQYNVRVINLSLGRPVYESYTLDPLCQAVEAAWKAGIVVVTAAGNDGRDNSAGTNGYGTIESPGNDPYVITVGAMKTMGTLSRTDDLVASYSSKGPTAVDHVVKPDLVAPGNHVVSLMAAGSTLAGEPANTVQLSYYQATYSSAPSRNFMMLNGTSMATPVVSGTVADILQGQPALSPDQVKARLMKTAYKTFPISSTAVDPVTGETFYSQYDLFTIGAGYLDVGAALANRDLAGGTAMSPIAVYDAASQNVYLSYDPSSIWDGSDVYVGQPVSGAEGAWTTQTVWGKSTVAGNKAIWGAASLNGSKSVWGAQGVWGSKAIWGASGPGATKAIWGADSSTSDSDADFTVANR